MNEERDLNKMLARDPAKLARMAIGVPRARAMTGGILALGLPLKPRRHDKR